MEITFITGNKKKVNELNRILDIAPAYMALEVSELQFT